MAMRKYVLGQYRTSVIPLALLTPTHFQKPTHAANCSIPHGLSILIPLKPPPSPRNPRTRSDLLAKASGLVHKNHEKDCPATSCEFALASSAARF